MDETAQQWTQKGKAARDAGDLPEALRAYWIAAAALRVVSEPLRLAHTIRHIADIQRQMGELDDAKANYAEALAIYRSNLSTSILDLANTLRGFALLMQQLDDPAAATAMWQEARALYNAVSVQAGVDEADRRLAALTH